MRLIPAWRAAPTQSATRGQGHRVKLSGGAKKGVAFPVFARSTSSMLRDDPRPGRYQENLCPRLCASLSRASFSPVLPLAPRPRPRQSSPRRPPSRSTPRRSSRTICESWARVAPTPLSRVTVTGYGDRVTGGYGDSLLRVTVTGYGDRVTGGYGDRGYGDSLGGYGVTVTVYLGLRRVTGGLRWGGLRWRVTVTVYLTPILRGLRGLR